MTPRGGCVLVIDADQRRTRPLVEQLSADGYAVLVARSGAHARLLARNGPPSIALLGSLGEPRSSLSLLEELRGEGASRARPRTTATIVLGRAPGELDVLRAFEAGADDYIGPGAGYLELRARLRAVERRLAHSRGETEIVEVDTLSIDTRAHLVWLEGHPLSLRRLEFDLLLHLAREPRRVFAKRELLSAVWGHTMPDTTRTLDSHASRVRRKLRTASARRWVINVWGIGYRLI